MADQEDEDLKLALSMSMQFSPPEPKRSKPGDAAAPSTPEDSRRTQRELMAAAAEKRMQALRGAPASSPVAATSATPPSLTPPKEESKGPAQKMEVKSGEKSSVCKMEAEEKLGRELTIGEAHELFSVVFGDDVSKGILAQWSNQGIRFSLDPETSMGLVQHEGGPCGVLAAVQAFVLKYLIFFLDELNGPLPGMPGPRTPASRQIQGSDNFASLSEDIKLRALIKSMSEILFSCGNGKTAVITTLDVLADDSVKDEAIAKALEGICIESASDLQKFLRVETYSSEAAVLQRLQATLPFFQSRMGAMLFLISALLSRGLDAIQADRDDPTLPLVTAPFGHASQEIVNLLLCGEAVPNVFDGRMDLGGGMFLKGISTSGEVGFLTLLESLNFCKVGQHLKCPKWPIWVVGSESHYTVLFALDTNVQKENELEQRESLIRRKFDQKDESGGGGFISVEAFHEFLRESDLRLPPEKIDSLCSSGFIVWSELWQIVLDLDKNLGGLKDSLMGKKVFDLYHFNGIAKSDLNGSGRETSVQRPRLTKLRVSVPPRWTPEEFMADVGTSSSSDKAEPPQHAPLVDCIRTRWARAVCNWAGDPPSIV